MTKEEQSKSSTTVMSTYKGRKLYDVLPKFLRSKNGMTIAFAAFFIILTLVLVIQSKPKVDPYTAAQTIIYGGGKYADAQAVLDSAIRNTGNKQTKSDFYLNKSTIAMDTAKITEAINFTQIADSLAPSSKTASMLGLEYSIQANKAQSIKWYKTAIARLDKHASGYKIDLQDLQDRVVQLNKP